MSQRIIYHGPEALKDYFYPKKLSGFLSYLDGCLGKTHQIEVYPDSMFKNNYFPNGITLRAKAEDALLLPHLLRDPGCGFLLFKLTGFHSHALNNPKLKRTLGEKLNQLLVQLENNKNQVSQAELQSALLTGLNSQDISSCDLSKYIYRQFSVDQKSFKPSQAELDALQADMGTITNTVELRRLHLKDQDIIGFIHTGCNAFPNLLSKRFTSDIMMYALDNQLENLDDLDRACYGVHLKSSLGYEYAQWLKAAMNFALVSRYQAFLAVAKLIEQTLDCEVSLLNDLTHAGLFELPDGEILTSRGAQLSDATNHPFSQLRLVAGEYNSIASLLSVEPSKESHVNFLPHGTGYEIPTLQKLNQFFINDNNKDQYIKWAQATHHNTADIYSNHQQNVLTHTYNHKVSVKHFLDRPSNHLIGELEPLITMHSPALLRTS